MNRCKLCHGEVNQDDQVYPNRFICSYCGEEQNESELITDEKLQDDGVKKN